MGNREGVMVGGRKRRDKFWGGQVLGGGLRSFAQFGSHGFWKVLGRGLAEFRSVVCWRQSETVEDETMGTAVA